MYLKFFIINSRLIVVHFNGLKYFQLQIIPISLL